MIKKKIHRYVCVSTIKIASLIMFSLFLFCSFDFRYFSLAIFPDTSFKYLKYLRIKKLKKYLKNFPQILCIIDFIQLKSTTETNWSTSMSAAMIPRTKKKNSTV